jgi:hypothetical protein
MYPDPLRIQLCGKNIFLAVFSKPATDLLPDTMGNVFYGIV